ncbi:hypothetical protein QJS10_CPA09g00315 [Acorus calamus]|uniref:Uncharacterized protein n=1 Tax=Acorus calamus TaxID=4465 RepID=A0AAV9E5X4_ACOCL|nr:hypothetical protein QJS10_CPA09g00315 [Acorus calamus]
MESFGETVTKVGLFFLVQALVYLILTKSSNLFSNSTTTSNMKSVGLNKVRSVTIRRIVAALADQPPEPSPITARTPGRLDESPRGTSFKPRDVTGEAKKQMIKKQLLSWSFKVREFAVVIEKEGDDQPYCWMKAPKVLSDIDINCGRDGINDIYRTFGAFIEQYG